MSRPAILEVILDSAAAAWLGLGSACLAWAILWPTKVSWAMIPLLLAAIGGGAAYQLLKALRTQGFSLAHFEPAAVPAEQPSELLLTRDMEMLNAELLLTHGQRLVPRSVDLSSGELLLEDVLILPDLNSRVVQLFDPARMPTAGELKSRIDRHLGSGRRAAPAEPQPDASQALFDALADLRRSLG